MISFLTERCLNFVDEVAMSPDFANVSVRLGDK